MICFCMNQTVFRCQQLMGSSAALVATRRSTALVNSLGRGADVHVKLFKCNCFFFFLINESIFCALRSHVSLEAVCLDTVSGP